jgi:hypothetical protein
MLGRRSAIAALFAGAATAPSIIKSAAEATMKGLSLDEADLPEAPFESAFDAVLDGPRQPSIFERIQHRLRDAMESRIYREERREVSLRDIPPRYQAMKSWSHSFRTRCFLEDLDAAEARRRKAYRVLNRLDAKALARAAKLAGIDVREIMEDVVREDRGDSPYPHRDYPVAVRGR